MHSLQIDPSGLSLDGVIALNNLFIQYSKFLTVVFPALESVTTATIYENYQLTSVEFPAFRAHTGDSSQYFGISHNDVLSSINLNFMVTSSSALSIMFNPVLTSLSLDRLALVHSYFSLVGNSSLTTLNLPQLASVATHPYQGLIASDCTNLANVSLPKYVPTKGRFQWFDRCALTQVSVDHILSRCVANANYTSGSVKLNGGTNATPGAQGQLDKATLIARGCTVLTN